MEAKFKLGQIIYYVNNNVMNSAPVISIRIVENNHEEWASTEEQKELFAPFGKAGVCYATCHGIWPEQWVYASGEEMLRALPKQSDGTEIGK